MKLVDEGRKSCNVLATKKQGANRSREGERRTSYVTLDLGYAYVRGRGKRKTKKINGMEKRREKCRLLCKIFSGSNMSPIASDVYDFIFALPCVVFTAGTPIVLVRRKR